MNEVETKIESWEAKLDELERKLTQIVEQRDSALRLLEHAQRELALALIKIEELEAEQQRAKGAKRG